MMQATSQTFNLAVVLAVALGPFSLSVLLIHVVATPKGPKGVGGKLQGVSATFTMIFLTPYDT